MADKAVASNKQDFKPSETKEDMTSYADLNGNNKPPLQTMGTSRTTSSVQKKQLMEEIGAMQ